ncbi:hypothetical protein TVAG_457080 [Trichomonas vaginalis G3]|uniref:Uncharacterized protein n=1 Tax=Trichomonas vaginalis (strain ATCC PRA-98 / G3) TaxID=412133 RepID=A2DC32_TRIV3|nr:hypothetical protein TVAGG3_0263540 [Trichomonas vaginalis G3]EAY22073.1 hypothetical protein TVAG_457080 [Trichomonas vaginalis G3]KAI5525298.1 hypothetical protein TVAGG3_0263540 [Trichomonas vaginalis G3]|eukprot:XP_001583059.1 hypothetical protein [Trichomonas vaginalis G3]
MRPYKPAFDETSSEISFLNRQKELRSLYSDFKKALEEMQYSDTTVTKTQDYFSEQPEVTQQDDTLNDELHAVLDEIRVLISEVIGIKADLRATGYDSHLELFDKLDNVLQILKSQRGRAESLLYY